MEQHRLGPKDLFEPGVGVLSSGVRAPIEVIVGFIDDALDEFGIKFICRHLPVQRLRSGARESVG